MSSRSGWWGRTNGSGGFGPAALVLVLLVGLVGGAVIYSAATSLSEGSAEDRPVCSNRNTIRMAVDPALHPVVVHALPKVERSCDAVDLTSQASGNIALAYSQGADLPDIWIADSQFWMTPSFLGRPGRLTLVDRSLATSPVLLVGGPRARRYASWGDAESSGQVSTPDPLTTTAGALALSAPLAEARKVGRKASEARQVLVPFAQDYGDRRSRGLDEQLSLDSVTRRTRRVQVATEQDLTETTNAQRLQVVTPRSGAPVQRFAMAVATGRRHSFLGGGGERSKAALRLAGDLSAYLHTAAGVALLHGEGLRAGDLGPIPGTGAGRITPLRTPRAKAIASRVQSWRTLSVPSSILAVVDASGSMDFSAGTRTRMELLSEAARLALDFLPDHARVGLWTFSADNGGPGRDWRVLEPTLRLDNLRFGRTQRFALRARATELVDLTGGGTGLYDTTLAAYRQALRDYKKNYSNAVVLMTDGANDDPGSISQASLLARLRKLRDPDRPVRIVAIGISQDADLPALRRIASATGGAAFLARDPTDIAAVFARAVLSR